MTSKELLDQLAEMKIPAKSASSALEDAYVSMVKKKLAPVIEARSAEIEAKKIAEQQAAAAEEAAAKAEAEKERIDKINAADSNIFTTEKQLKEYGEKLPADKKAAIETALGKLKEAHKNADVAAIDTAMAELNAAWQAASQDIYAQQQAQQGAQPGADAGQQSQSNAGGQQGGGDGQPEDVEFEEVK